MKKVIFKYGKFLGFFILPLIWVVLKYCFQISDRFLPSPISVFDAFIKIEPNVFKHLFWTTFRLVIGFSSGILFGVFLGIYIFKSKFLYNLLVPSIQSLRSVPATATIPFFLLWFGFDEKGKFILIITGIAFNLALSVLVILKNIPYKYLIFFKSINKSPSFYQNEFIIPILIEKLLPVVRFSLSTAIGLVIVSEFLGSQIGLGYLIQTSKSTFSMNVIFACMILLGILNFVFDKILVLIWKKINFWKI